MLFNIYIKITKYIYIYNMYIRIHHNIEIHDWGLLGFYSLLNSHERNWYGFPRYRYLTIVLPLYPLSTGIGCSKPCRCSKPANIQWTQINYPNLATTLDCLQFLANHHFDGTKHSDTMVKIPLNHTTVLSFCKSGAMISFLIAVERSLG